MIKAYLLDEDVLICGKLDDNNCFTPNSNDCGFEHQQIQENDIGKILFFTIEESEKIVGKKPIIDRKPLEINTFRTIKINAEAVFEFLYEKFIDDEELYLDIDALDVTNTFYFDKNTGEFIFLAYNSENKNGEFINFPKELNIKKLCKNMKNTTSSMFSENRYKDYSLKELIALQK